MKVKDQDVDEAHGKSKGVVIKCNDIRSHFTNEFLYGYYSRHGVPYCRN